MIEDELNSILSDIEKNEFSDIPKSQNKYNTADFSIESILKEYGIDDSTSKPKAQKKPIATKPEPVIEKEEVIPAPVAIQEEKAEVVTEPEIKTTHVEEAPIETISKTTEEPIVIEEPTKEKLQLPNTKEIELMLSNFEKHSNEKAKTVIEEPITESKTEAPKPVAQKPAEKNEKIDIFNNDDIMTALAANKLGTNPYEPEKKEMTQIFTEEQEEDFKMRSGYIDLEAIKAATSAVSLENKKSAPVEPDMDTNQKLLFGKIGSFFSDTTFRYDTSTVNVPKVAEADAIKKSKKNTTAKKQEDKDEFIPIPGDICETDDIPVVEQELLSQINLSFLKIILTSILAIPLAVLNLFPNLLEDILPSMAPSSPFNYSVANLAILLIIAIININIVFKGLVGLFTIKPTGSTMVSLAILTAMGYSIYSIVNTPSNVVMYGFVAALSVVFVLIGKYVYYKNVYKNFELLAFKSTKTACVKTDTGYSLKDLYTENTGSTSCRPVSLLTYFLTNSFDCNFADTISKFALMIAFVAGIAMVALTALKNGMNSAFSIASVVFAILSPFCYDLAYSMPLINVSNKIRKTGSAVVSYSVAKEYSGTESFVMCDSDLFRPENIIVHSMKINGNEKINDVIINCASLIHASGSPVSGAFMSILDNKDEMLMPVTNFDWAPGKGYSGEIGATRYFIGSSQYLADCGIKLPTIDLEEKYKRIGRQVVMFADSNKLLAVFSISYSKDELIYRNLHKISLNDMGILVLSRDNNITSTLLSQIYEIDEKVFMIASKEEYNRMYHHDQPIEKYPAGIYSITGAGGVTTALSNCKRLLSTVKISVIFRTLALASAVLIMVYAIVTGNADKLLTAKNIVLFHLLWTLPTLFVSMFAG